MQADKALQIFSYEGKEVRTVLDEKGNPWWVAKDVCTILEIKKMNQAINGNSKRDEDGLDEDERGYYIVGTPRGKQKMLCVNEPGLYALIFKSRKPEAKAFKRWVTHEVLPSIRKTGSYSIHQDPEPTGFTNLLYVERAKLFSRYTKIPTRKFCVFEKILTPFLKVELQGVELPDKAIPDISVGNLWCKYAREVLRFNMDLVKKYTHHYPDKRGKQPANTYPIEWLPAFEIWFQEVYIPEHLPQYLKYLKATNDQIRLIMKAFGVNYQVEGGK